MSLNQYLTPSQGEIERFWNIGNRNQAQWWEATTHPRAVGPFIRAHGSGRELVTGQWALIPHFAKMAKLPYQTNNARSEELSSKASYRQSWQRGQRCIIPALSFDEPCWEIVRHEWWQFRRRSEEHTTELQTLMRNSYDVICLIKKKQKHRQTTT